MLMRWDPFHELDRLADWPSWRRSAVPMDAYRRGGDLVLHFDLPGVDRDSIDLTVERDVLTLRAERRSPASDEAKALVAERAVGTFTRRLFLGESLDVDKLEADYDRGVLTVTIPVEQAARPRKIEIGGTEEPEAIASGSQAA